VASEPLEVRLPRTAVPKIIVTDPDRLPPPPFWRTRYFAFTVMGKADRR
jgi:hypothetical protein